MITYLDCNATTPPEPEVYDAMARTLREEFGNAGSRTHEYGARAKQMVETARGEVAALAGARREEIVFTSGATESNNIALLGLEQFARANGRTHIISTHIEHKAVLEPLAELTRRGFEVELLQPNPAGVVGADQVSRALRPDTLAVSVMHANNETGVIQPLDQIVEAMRDHPAFLHVDAAQTFGKLIAPLTASRVDLISVSAHKVYGPKGIGALIARRRGYDRLPLTPLQFGGGQERGLRPGTLPVPLIVGFGVASRCALAHHAARAAVCAEHRKLLLEHLLPLRPILYGDQARVLPHVINMSFPGIDSEALMVSLKSEIAISNGSACTSSSYTLSHVLKAMDVPDAEISGAIRISWCHLTPAVDWANIARRIEDLL